MAKHILFHDSISVNHIQDSKLDKWIQTNLNRCKEENNKRVYSNVGGFQTESILDQEITNLLSVHLMKAMKDFTEKKFKYALRSLWINENYKFCYNDYHIHPDSHFSGVYYTKTPKYCGNILFHRSSSIPFLGLENFFKNKDTLATAQIEPLPGMLIIFPGCLAHSVRINESDESRVSISFNFNLLSVKK